MPAALAVQQRDQGVAGHARVRHTATRPRTRTSATAQPGDPVLLLRPADRRTPTSCGCSRTAATPPPCSASTRTAPRARPATRWRPRSRRPPRPTAASSTSCTTSPAGRPCSPRSRPTGPPRCPPTPRRRRTRGRTASRWCASGASASTTRNHPLDAATCLDVINWFKGQGCYVIGGVPRGLAHRHRRLARRLPRTCTTRSTCSRRGWSARIGTRRGLRLRSTTTSTCRPGRLQRQRHRLPALRAARRRLGEPARPRRLHVAPVLQHGPRRRPGHLHLDVRRVQRGQPDRQDGRDPGRCPGRLRPAGPGRGRHRLLLRLLPAAHRRRRPHAQGPDRADRDPPDPAHARAPPPP